MWGKGLCNPLQSTHPFLPRCISFRVGPQPFLCCCLGPHHQEGHPSIWLAVQLSCKALLMFLVPS